MKLCSLCGKTKPESEFGSARGRPGGLAAYCRPCAKEYSAKRRKGNPEPHRKASREWARRNSEHIKDKRRARYLKHRLAYRDQQLRRDHGIGQAEYEEALVLQGNKCGICRRHAELHLHGKHLHIDHDHRSGKIRGLLCSRCNHALGLLLDNKQIAANLIEYLTDPPYARIR